MTSEVFCHQRLSFRVAGILMTSVPGTDEGWHQRDRHRTGQEGYFKKEIFVCARMHTHVCVPWVVQRSEDSLQELVLPSITWVLKFELRSSGLVAGTFTCRAIPPALPLDLIFWVKEENAFEGRETPVHFQKKRLCWTMLMFSLRCWDGELRNTFW